MAERIRELFPRGELESYFKNVNRIGPQGHIVDDESRARPGGVEVEVYTLMVYTSTVPEKRKPTYDLGAFKSTFSKVEGLRVTGTALRDAANLGFGRAEIVATIQTMERSHFYKSMTSHADSSVWQDVYHVPSSAGVLYVKFTAETVTEFLLLSFKEKDDA